MHLRLPEHLTVPPGPRLHIKGLGEPHLIPHGGVDHQPPVPVQLHALQRLGDCLLSFFFFSVAAGEAHQKRKITKQATSAFSRMASKATTWCPNRAATTEVPACKEKGGGDVSNNKRKERGGEG